jgi:hypothetical protein
VLTAKGDGGNDVVIIAGQDYPDWDLPVAGTIGGIKRPAAAIEAHFPANIAVERGLERDSIHGS